jgi:hypothetical protein
MHIEKLTTWTLALGVTVILAASYLLDGPSDHETAQAIQADITYSKAAARDAAILESRCKTLRGPSAELVMVGTDGDYACRVITSK